MPTPRNHSGVYEDGEGRGSTRCYFEWQRLVGNILGASNGYVGHRPRGIIMVFDQEQNIGPGMTVQAIDHIEGSEVFHRRMCMFAEDKEGRSGSEEQGNRRILQPASVFDSEGFDAQQILIEQDGNTQLLLETESVSSIAVDGATQVDRTQTSGYSDSSDGQEQIHHSRPPIVHCPRHIISIAGTS